MKKEMLVITVLVVLLLVAGGFLCVNWFNNSKQAAMKQGAELGYQQAVLDLLDRAASCQPVPVHVGNISANMIAVECLQQGQQPGPQAAAPEESPSAASQPSATEPTR